MDFLKIFDPATYIAQETYLQMYLCFAGLFKGMLPRMIALTFLVSSFWVSFYRKNILMALLFFSVAVFFTYVGGLFAAMGF